MRYTATSVNTTAGTPSGAVTDTWSQDELWYSVTESNTSGITSTFTIGSSSRNLLPDALRIFGWYSGAAAHYIDVQIYNYDTTSYETIGVMQGGSSPGKEYIFSIGHMDSYHSSANGAMQVRFLHSVTTYNPAHSLNINALWVQKETTIDKIWDEVVDPNNSTHTVEGSAAQKLWRTASVGLYSGTAQGPGALGAHNQIQFDTGALSTDGAYDPARIILVGGTGAGQTRNILEYDGASRTATVDRGWKVDPAADTQFIVIGESGRAHVNEGLAQDGGSNYIQLNSLASAQDDVYRGQVVFLCSGVGEDQAQRIIAYNGTTKVATVAHDWTGTAPSGSTGYIILPTSAMSEGDLGKAIWSETYGTYAGIPDSAAEALYTVAEGLAPTLIAALADAVGKLISGNYQAGSVAYPYVVPEVTPLVLYADTDMSGITFDVGVQWALYLGQPDSEVWFTVKDNPRNSTPLIDAQGVIADADNGQITLDLDSTQLDVKEGTYFWQLLLVREVDPGPPAVIVRRMLLEGKVYIKPTFKS